MEPCNIVRIPNTLQIHQNHSGSIVLFRKLHIRCAPQPRDFFSCPKKSSTSTKHFTKLLFKHKQASPQFSIRWPPPISTLTCLIQAHGRISGLVAKYKSPEPYKWILEINASCRSCQPTAYALLRHQNQSIVKSS